MNRLKQDFEKEKLRHIASYKNRLVKAAEIDEFLRRLQEKNKLRK